MMPIWWWGSGGSSSGGTFATPKFLDLYTTELTRELGSADGDTVAGQLFTPARRKAAINAGQLEFVKRTECFVNEVSIALVDGTAEYSLETAAPDIFLLSKRGLSIQITDASSNVRYVEGDDLVQVDPERLNVEQTGWRAAPKGTPTKFYIKRKGGQLLLGFTPPPGSFAAGATWVAILPYVVLPATMTADTDTPFTYSGAQMTSMSPWYRAIVHYAAFDCEKYRKDQARGAAQLQLFEAEVAKFSGLEKPKGPRRVRLTRDYRRDARRFTTSAAQRNVRIT